MSGQDYDSEQRIAAIDAIVMPGFMPGIHVHRVEQKDWMAGTSQAMTDGELHRTARMKSRGKRNSTLPRSAAYRRQRYPSISGEESSAIGGIKPREEQLR